MFGIQKLLDKELRELPNRLVENLITNKLRAAGVLAPKELSKKILEHIGQGKSEPFVWESDDESRNVSLSISQEDVDEVERTFTRFIDDDLSIVMESVAERASKSLLKHLKNNWTDHCAWQDAAVTGFRARLEERWGEAFNLLRMLLTIALELGAEAHKRHSRSKVLNRKQVPSVIFRLHARACQVTAEIISLMENGYADGAMARWRTLHEIGIAATLIHEGGESIAERYIEHQIVEAKSAMEEYARCHLRLGYKPMSKRDVRKITRNYDAALLKYGKDFGSQYGWAAQQIKVKKPTFAQLEAAAGRAEMRSHYKMASYNVHANPRGAFFRLGLIEPSSIFLAGPSNAGFMEPGQNTALTLAQITVLLLGPRWKFDEIIAMKILVMLRNESARAFVKAERKLRREEAGNRRHNNS